MSDVEVKNYVTVKMTAVHAICPHCGWSLGSPPPLLAEELAMVRCPRCNVSSKVRGPLTPLTIESAEISCNEKKEKESEIEDAAGNDSTTRADAEG